MSRLNVETRTVTADSIYDDFWNAMEQRNIKEAELEGSQFIRTELRQESIAREIFDGSDKLEPDDLDRSAETDQPRRIEEIEPDSVATFVPFNGTARRKWFKGKRFEIFFGKIESQRNVKNKFNLMSYRSDIRKILTENAIYDMADVEDQLFFDEVDNLLSLPASAGQTLNLSGGLSAQNIVSGIQNMIQRKYPIGKLVMSKSLHWEAAKIPATSVGDRIAERHYDKGLTDETHLWGIPVITTIKNDIVKDNEFYVFTTQEFLGYHYHLQDATLYIKEEADIYEFFTYSSIGIGLAGNRGVTKVVL